MCLSNVSLNMFYDEKEKDFVGIGYKVISIRDDRNRINWSMSKFLKPHVWTEASGDFDKILPKNTRFKLSTESDDKKYYWPGFHIFLDINHARLYSEASVLVEVKFKGVTCFGKQGLYHDITKNVDCVIARYAKVTKIVSKTAEDYVKSLRNGLYPEPYMIYEE